VHSLRAEQLAVAVAAVRHVVILHVVTAAQGLVGEKGRERRRGKERGKKRERGKEREGEGEGGRRRGRAWKRVAGTGRERSGWVRTQDTFARIITSHKERCTVSSDIIFFRIVRVLFSLTLPHPSPLGQLHEKQDV